MLPALSNINLTAEEAKSIPIQEVTYRASPEPFIPKRGIYFIRKGNVLIRQTEENVFELKEGDYFTGKLNQNETDQLTILSDAIFGFVSSDILKRRLGETMTHYDFTNLIAAQASLNLWNKVNKISDVGILDLLGEGTFGEVFRVYPKSDRLKKKYAMKIMGKKKLIDLKAVSLVTLSHCIDV